MIALDLPPEGAGRRDQLAAAGEVVEVFDDDIGVHDDVAIVCYQRRQFFHGVDARIFVVGLARHHGSGDEFDFVDQAEFDRGNAHLAGEWRGRGECEFHGVSFKESKAFLFWVMAGLVPAIHVFLSCCDVVKTWMPGTSPRMTSFAVALAQAYAATISWRCSPSPSMLSVTTSPTLRNFGGFMPEPTPGGVPVVTMSPGNSVRNCET